LEGLGEAAASTFALSPFWRVGEDVREGNWELLKRAFPKVWDAEKHPAPERSKPRGAALFGEVSDFM